MQISSEFLKNAFSDGRPEVELLVFIFCLGFALLVVSQRRLTVLLNRGLRVLTECARRRGAFPEHGVKSDLRRIDLARILFGGIATIRFWQLTADYFVRSEYSEATVAGAGMLLGALVMFGLFTPIATLLLMSTGNILVDNYLGSSTLGTQVMSIGMLLLLLAPAGRTLSIDALMVRKGGLLRLIGTRLHWISGPVSPDRLLVAKMASLFVYFCLCLYSLVLHLQDQQWVSGWLPAQMLLSPAANPKYFELAWMTYETFPTFVVSFSVVSSIGMALFYLLVLPGVFMGRWMRRFVISWGFLFFLVSTFVLPLSFLGPYQVILWLALFLPGAAFGSTQVSSIVILFDDRCNLCARSVKVLTALDLFGRLEFRGIRRNAAFAAEYGITSVEGMRDIVGVDLRTSTQISGYDLYNSIAARVVLLWPLKPFLALGRLTHIGPAIYRWVAVRRTRLFGECEIFTPPDNGPTVSELHVQIDRGTTASALGLGRLVLTVTVVLGILSAAFFARFPFNAVEVTENRVSSLSRVVFGAAPLAVGLGPIDVFNEKDTNVFKFINKISPVPGGQSHDFSIFGSDAIRYGIVPHSRRMASMNLGCDREFFESIAPLLSAGFAGQSQQVLREIEYSIDILTLPIAEDFQKRRPLQFNAKALCRARIDLFGEKGKRVLDLVFLQEGVNESLRQKGFEPDLAADRVEVALKYPCRVDGYFLSALAAGRPALVEDKELNEVLERQKRDIRGRFSVDCFMDASRISIKWPGLLHQSVTVISPDICDSAVIFFGLLTDAARDMAPVLRPLQVSLAAVKAARLNNDFQVCNRAAISGWAQFLSAMGSPVTNTAG